jgi:hypothetical protein
MDSALFLATFLATLSKLYKEKCAAENDRFYSPTNNAKQSFKKVKKYQVSPSKSERKTLNFAFSPEQKYEIKPFRPLSLKPQPISEFSTNETSGEDKPFNVNDLKKKSVFMG